MADIITLGELLIDLTQSGSDENGNGCFVAYPGGAPANVLAAASKLGLKTAFIGKVGYDMQGQLLRETLEENGISTDGLLMDPDVFTTLAFVQLRGAERSFSFARKPGADTMIREDEVDADLIRDSYIFHFGSLSLTDEPARSATHYAVSCARDAGAIISYDPNYRAPLWKSREEAVEKMRSVIHDIDIMKVSDEETGLLTGKDDPAGAAGVLLEKGVKILVITLGSRGAMLATPKFSVTAASRPVDVVDTTGAGDSFWGGFLSRIAAEKVKPAQITRDQAEQFLHYANTVAGLCVGKRGAIPAMPTAEEVRKALMA